MISHFVGSNKRGGRGDGGGRGGSGTTEVWAAATATATAAKMGKTPPPAEKATKDNRKPLPPHQAPVIEPQRTPPPPPDEVVNSETTTEDFSSDAFLLSPTPHPDLCLS